MTGGTPLTIGGGSVLLERDVGVVARDGVRLSVDIYRPKRPGRLMLPKASRPTGRNCERSRLSNSGA